MSILVLGGAGYIGSHTAYALKEAGADVAIADNLQTGYKGALHPDARFYLGDIRDRAFLDDLFSREHVDAVIHFAANSLVGESMKLPLKYYDNNLCGTKTLLEAMVAHGVDKIVFSSTAAVYGEPERVPISEDDSTVPTNTYGETKLAMERMFHWVGEAHGLKYVSLRYFNACGAHESGEIGEAHDPETHLIPIAVQAALGVRAGLSIYGGDYPTRDGTCVRDYIHVSDLASAHILAVNHLQNGGASGRFNLGNGEGFTVREILSAVERVSGRHIETKMDERRPGDPASLVANSEKARRVLGWTPRYTDIEGIVRTAWVWHSRHPRGYRED